MIENVLGFIELGGVVLAWTVFWNFLIRQFTAHHSGSASMQGLAAMLHA